MIKSIKAILAQDKEKFKVPRKVQDLIPIKNIWPDGIFKVGNKFSKSFRFSDINYLVASREDKESMFLTYSELLNSLDSGATTKITINNHRLNKSDFEESILMPMKQDGLDEYRKEYNDMLLDKATGANGITQEKYITITVAKKDIEEARAYFARIGADLTAHFANLGSKCVPLNAVERLRILHDFYRPGDEAAFSFDMNRKARLGHDFRDYICPDSMDNTKLLFPVLLLCDENGEYIDFTEDDIVSALEDADDSDIRYFKPTEAEQANFNRIYNRLIGEAKSQHDKAVAPVLAYNKRKIENWVNVQREQLQVQLGESKKEVEDLIFAEMTASDSLEKKDIRKKTAEAKKRMDKLQREFPKRQNEIENEAKNEIDSFNRSQEINPILLVNIVLKF